jgi:transcriptional regulator of arginine metabolism
VCVSEYSSTAVNIHPQRRREAILRIVDAEVIPSQEVLAERLAQRGFQVAQPTLSRDLRELGLAKAPGGYTRPGAKPARADRELERTRVLREFVLSAVAAGTLVVLRTPPAGAHPVARALDEAPPRDVVGTIAGDDTIFLATTSSAAAQRLAKRLQP